ncbi:hypothetical protein [Faecalibacterium prausnitzii]|jgi:hypothetical protein|uniref:hypothetical protein n=1 Tax=Faecalibacterium prausnitzii TaxID=853 RepID=UPI001CBCE01D|nr:hypothetical protein [Faecalibacterium prausnitzii]
MKMFKRFAAALLAGVMVLAMLTACGGGSGSGTSTIGEEFENKYIAAINTLRGENAGNLENDTDLRNKALAQLAKIKEDGTIAATDANTSIVTPSADGKSVTVVMISVGTKGEPDKGVCQAKEITAESLDEITPDSAGADVVEALRALKKIGIATKVINGKTYAAIAMEIVQSVS